MCLRACVRVVVVRQVPIDDYELPLSCAEVVQQGSDITLVGYGAQVLPWLHYSELQCMYPACLHACMCSRRLASWFVGRRQLVSKVIGGPA